DPTKIHQVVMNLCTNAIYAMKDNGGTLEVILAETDVNPTAKGMYINGSTNAASFICLTVSDTGSGMDSFTIERIFEPYFTTKDPEEGTGTGLVTVKTIVQDHKGLIDIQSAPGEGSKFKVFFPWIKNTDQKKIEPPAQTKGGNERILFIDNEPTLVELGQEILEHLGYKVTGSTSSIKALEDFKNNPEQFDLVITDFIMPGLSGIQLAQHLFKIRPDIPVILCTGFSELSVAEKSRE
ncbi:MAG: response regulator, partial [bacterium]|nr:response regulator [bacterium]